MAGLRYEAIPAEVVARIKLLMLDSLGCAIFGADLPWSRILRETLAAVDTSQGCTVWGSSQRLSAPHAALVNGTLVQSFELDDVHRVGVLHVGAVTLPGVLAVAEMHPGMSGRDLLTACVAGLRDRAARRHVHGAGAYRPGLAFRRHGRRVQCRAPGPPRRCVCRPSQVVHALGIAGTQAAGLMAAQFGAMVKRMHAGRSAQSGLYGALLAQRGFTGIADVFENEYGGFCTTFSRSTDRFDRALLTKGLGREWETMRIALKFYSCVGSNHTTLDAIRTMQARHPFGPEDVADITGAAGPASRWTTSAGPTCRRA